MVIGVSSEEMDAVINGGQLLRGLTSEIICFGVMKMVAPLTTIAILKTMDTFVEPIERMDDIARENSHGISGTLLNIQEHGFEKLRELY